VSNFDVVYEKDGKWVVENIHYRRYSDLGWVISVGETDIGLALNSRADIGWWGVPYSMPGRTVKGFISRRKAVEYLLIVKGYWGD
jgi:hypothetical protein